MLVESMGERVLFYYMGGNINWYISGSQLEMYIYFEPLVISTKKINRHMRKDIIYLPTYQPTTQPATINDVPYMFNNWL